MSRFIIKLERDGEARYLEWSTICDAPITKGMTLDDFKEHYLTSYGRSRFEALHFRLARVEKYGTSSTDEESVDDFIVGNCAGNDGSELTKEELWDKYCSQ